MLNGMLFYTPARVAAAVATSVCCLAIVLVQPVPAADESERPYVAGFERFGRGGHERDDAALDRAEAGALLIRELNCAGCHSTTLSRFHPKVAPRLQDVAARLRPESVKSFIANPHRVLPGSTMPEVLRGEGADEEATALTHYLVSTRTRAHRPQFSDAVAAERGGVLFHQVGCVACHAAAGQSGVEWDHTSRALNEPEQRYDFAGLRAFLLDPLKTRPSARMPHLRLSGREADDLAHYLLRKTQVPATLVYRLSHGRSNLDDKENLQPVRTGPVDGFTLDLPHRSNDFALEFRGFLRVDEAGEYRFFLSADEGARLRIDGRVVVENPDRRRPDRFAEATLELTTGWHRIELDYFQRGRESHLQLLWAPPGEERGAIPSDHLRNTAESVDPYQPWQPDPELARRGRELFTSRGCIACHQPPGGGSQETGMARPLAEIDAGRGCLAAEPGAGQPNYHLDNEQREAIAAALANAGEARVTPQLRTVRTMLNLNCFACHRREGRGGVSDLRLEYFTAAEADLGDEGRVPPALDGVGDKLRPDWLRAVVERGESVRPYMHTRMPRFGDVNVRDLAEDLVAQDRRDHTVPTVPDSAEIARDQGRSLVGKGKLHCVSCHIFNGHKSTGVQFMDLATTTRRLNEDWFHRYLRTPAEFRPGTRMPQAWPRGRSLFGDVLDGDTDRQISAVWRYLADGERAINPEGIVPRNLELVVSGRPVVYRNKLWEAGWRGIGVGYPEHVNLAFDAEAMRLALLWRGRFLNVTAHWAVQGMGRIRPAGRDVIVLPQGPALAILDTPDAAWPKEFGRAAGFRFGGYFLDELDRPTFMYRLGDVAVEDTTKVEPGPRPVFVRTLRFQSEEPPESLWFRAWSGNEIRKLDEGGYRCERLTVRTGATTDAQTVLRSQQGEDQLLIPIVFRDGRAEVQLRYEW